MLRSIQRFGRLGRRSNGPGLKAGGTGAAAGGPALHAVPQRKVRQSNFSKDSKESRCALDPVPWQALSILVVPTLPSNVSEPTLSKPSPKHEAPHDDTGIVHV